LAIENVDEERFLDLASRIDEDRPVDWDLAEQSARDESERAIVSALRVVAHVAGVVRASSDSTITGHDSGDTVPEVDIHTWGSFVILGPIGRGSFGKVYRARDTLGRDVALKLFSESQAPAIKDDRIRHEARVLASIRHHNIVDIYRADWFDGRFGLCMELIQGRTLADELRARGVFSAEEATLIGLDLCRALAAVHDAGLVHRDVKARNVMREVGGRIVLMDFGAGIREDTAPTSVLDIAGTPLYLAPEVFNGEPASRASDIYSLGVLLYYLVGGTYPVVGASRKAIQEAHAQGRRRLLRDARPDLSETFVRIIETAIDPDPRKRFQTAGAFERALSRFPVPDSVPAMPVRESNQTVPPSPVPTPPVAWWRTKTAIGLSLALGAVLIYVITQWPPVSKVNPEPVNPPVPAIAPSADSYTIDAALYKSARTGPMRLAPGDRIAPGDEIGVTISGSMPLYVYVVNEDEHGERYLLFPSGGTGNPLAAGEHHELPGRHESGAWWTVTSAGGREHFVLVASPVRKEGIERAIEHLPRPVEHAKVSPPRLSSDLFRQLRGVGGVEPERPTTESSASVQFLFSIASPLQTAPESVHGVWIRQIALENPAP